MYFDNNLGISLYVEFLVIVMRLFRDFVILKRKILDFIFFLRIKVFVN